MDICEVHTFELWADKHYKHSIRKIFSKVTMHQHVQFTEPTLEEPSEHPQPNHIKNRRLTPYIHVIDKDDDEGDIEPMVLLKVKQPFNYPQTPRESLKDPASESTVVENLNEPNEEPMTVITVGRKRNRLNFLTWKMKLFTVIYFAIFIILICVTLFTPSLASNTQYFLGVLLAIYCFSYFIVFIMICNQYRQTSLWTLTVNTDQLPPCLSSARSSFSAEVQGWFLNHIRSLFHWWNALRTKDVLALISAHFSKLKKYINIFVPM